MDLDTLRALPPEERERILEIQVDFSLLADALNMCASVLHGITEAETVAEVTPEDMNDAEASLPKATEALARLREEFERHDKYLEDAKIGFSEHVCKLKARIKELEGAIRYHRESLSSGHTTADQVLWMYVSRETERAV
jgi:SpoVK/Ycf46/Vps4 family AAA+-type ATPase